MLASEGIKRVELGRDELEKRVWEWKEKFRPRILIDVSKIDMTTTVLGFKISMPIMIAPTTMQKMAHPEGMNVLIPHLRPAEYKRSRLPRNRRTVNRAYGGFEEGFEDSENQGKCFIKEPVQLIKDSL
ncbi:hypothetical protein GOBAR_DD05828 [Gossypium barbadense]|nr:hypothetical protein GOBAR_DD05828 [Gossypium barbadense]